MNPLMSAMRPMNNLGSLLSLMRGNDPNAVMQLLARRNPQFRQFYQSCQGKTMEQVAQEYGIDPAQVRQMLK